MAGRKAPRHFGGNQRTYPFRYSPNTFCKRSEICPPCEARSFLQPGDLLVLDPWTLSSRKRASGIANPKNRNRSEYPTTLIVLLEHQENHQVGSSGSGTAIRPGIQMWPRFDRRANEQVWFARVR